MKTFEDYSKTQEYELWETLYNYSIKNNLIENKIIEYDDYNEYSELWEPYIEMVFKLGVVFKQTGKQKELKPKWIRPIFFMKQNHLITMDDKVYEPPKESVYNGQEVSRKLADLSKIIERFPEVSSSWKSLKKEFQKASERFWKSLIKFVTKVGFRELNQVVKWILAPLLRLRKASLNLFRIEMKEAGVADFVIFDNKADCITFTNNVKAEFKEHEDKKMQRDMQVEDLKKFIDKTSEESQYIYKFREDKLVSEEIKDEMKIFHFKFQKDALQAEFESGLTDCFKYFFEKSKLLESKGFQGIDMLLYAGKTDKEKAKDKEEDLVIKFYDCPDVRKLFVNLTVKDYDIRKSLAFYIDDMNRKIFMLKVMLYEMKMNGTARIEMPISKNIDFTAAMLDIYNLHHKMDRLFGNHLSYDQYLFFYECLNNLNNSNFNLRNEVEHLKNKEFIEESLPKYIVLQAMRKAVQIEERIRGYLKEQGALFNRNDYYQITQYELDSANMHYIYDYDVKRNPLYGDNIQPELDLIRKKIEEEITKYEGRYWLLEGFFNAKEDKEDWINAIEILRNINVLVQDDIRDYILQHHKEKDLKMDKRRESHRSGSKNNFGSTNSITKINPKERITSGRKKSKKTQQLHSNKIRVDTNQSYESDDDSVIVSKKTDLKSENLRPPNLWNFPIDDIKMKIFMNSKKDNKEAKYIDEIVLNIDVRKVDPRDFYKDGRVRDFLAILEKLTSRMLQYSTEVKQNIFKFYMDCTLNTILTSSKSL